jgi:hypothetical protein
MWVFRFQVTHDCATTGGDQTTDENTSSPRQIQAQNLECGKPDFTWQGKPHLPYVSLLNGTGTLEPFVILTSSMCRRPMG